MKILSMLLLAAGSIPAVFGQALGDNTVAILSVDKSGAATIKIVLDAKDTPPATPDVSLFESDGKIEKQITGLSPAFGANFSTIGLQISAANLRSSYTVVLMFDSNAAGGSFRRRITIPVKVDPQVELARIAPACTADNNIEMVVTTASRWDSIYGWLSQYKKNRAIFGRLIAKQKGEKNKEYNVVSTVSDTAAGDQLGVCLVLDGNLPTGNFDAELTLSNTYPSPPGIQMSISSKKLDGTLAMKFPDNEERESPEKWTLENNLNLGVAFTTSVIDDAKAATATTPASFERKRKNVGYVDLSFEFPEVLHPIYKRNAWVTFLTPFFLKAAVSSEKIDKDTLSQNRILFGFLGESRYRQWTKGDDKSNSKPLAIHRVEWGMTHASDRDFKQDEIYASISYKPNFDSINRPYRLNYRIGTGADGKSVREQKFYGFSVEPSIGFDFGRTYRRRNPAEAIEISPTIKRLNLGIKLGLNLTEFVSLSATNTLYVRGEDSSHRFRNLFKTEADIKLFRTNRNRAAHGLFVSYEKGQGPPFSGAHVNSIKVGYRVIGNFLCEVCR